MSYSTNKSRYIEDIPHVCHKNNSQYEIFEKRFQLLQKYIPENFSTNFRNPCWYDFHQTPSSHKMEIMQKETKKHMIGRCSTPLSYIPSLAKDIVEQAMAIGKRHLYCLPSFFLSGFPKCASTTLYTMILKHPKIATPRCKETHFWAQFVNQQGTDLDKKMQILQYMDYFSPSVRIIQSKPGKITLDASVGYHTWNTEFDYCVLPTLLRRVLPEAKFIVIMRNPSERVFSHYFYFTVRRHYESVAAYSEYVRNKLASEVLHRYISNVIMKFQSCLDSGHSTPSCVRNKTIDGKNTDRNGHTGLQTSMYYYHIVPWLNIFPRERFLFLRTEDLAHSQSLTMSKVWHFLNLDGLPKTKNAFAKANYHSVFSVHTRKLLDAFFQPYNELLANLLSDSRYLWKD